MCHLSRVPGVIESFEGLLSTQTLLHVRVPQALMG